jgi:hypothetical protein
VDAIAKFGKKEMMSLDEKTFAEILAEVRAHTLRCKLRQTNHRLRLYIGIEVYGTAVARKRS